MYLVAQNYRAYIHRYRQFTLKFRLRNDKANIADKYQLS